jgi:hypothetical protein
MNIACVMGNGPSRKQFDLDTIHATMYTYGCNALYRDFIPDYLISLDVIFVSEIIENTFHKKTKFYTQDSAKFRTMSKEDMSYINLLTPMRKRMDSGNSALELACLNGHDIIYIIGFDYDMPDSSLPNVYVGTKNYQKTDMLPAVVNTTFQWKNRIRKLVKEFSNIQFIRVNGSGTNSTVEATNYSEITPEQFKEIYDPRT